MRLVVVVIVGPRPGGCMGDWARNWTINVAVLMPVTRLDQNLQQNERFGFTTSGFLVRLSQFS